MVGGNLLLMKKSIITIAGKPGSGKSSTADLVASRLGYARHSSGDFMRAIARRRGVSINTLSEIAESDETIDFEIDEENKKLNDAADIVVDARLAFHFIPESFKVYLDLDLPTAARRIFGQRHPSRKESGEAAQTPREMEALIAARLASEKKRYRHLYGIDHTDPRNFDLVINTAHHSLPEVADIIVEEYQKWRGDEKRSGARGEPRSAAQAS